MAITYQSASTTAYSAAAGATVAANYPASLAAGDLILLIVGQKPATANGGGVTTPTGFTLISSLSGAGGYGATLGADTGNTNLFVYGKASTGSETGTLTVNLTNNNVAWATMLRLSGSGYWKIDGATGSDTSAGNVSITFGSDPGVTAGDYVIGAMCIPTDVTTPAQFSAEALSQTGITFGAVSEIYEPDSGNGNDIGGLLCRAAVSSGTSSAAPTMTATAGGTTTNVRGPGIFVRIRELVHAIEQTNYRLRNDDDTDEAATWKAAVNTSTSIAANANFRVRLGVKNNSSLTYSLSTRFYYRRNGGSWTLIDDSGTIVEYALSSFITHNELTSQQITSGTYYSGNAIEQFGSINWDIPPQQFLESEACLYITDSGVADGDTIDIGIYDNTKATMVVMTVPGTFTVTGGTLSPPSAVPNAMMMMGMGA